MTQNKQVDAVACDKQRDKYLRIHPALPASDLATLLPAIAPSLRCSIYRLLKRPVHSR